MTVPHLPSLSEHEIELHLSKLPQMQMSAHGDELFFSKLNAVLLAERGQVSHAQEEHVPRFNFLAGFTRFAFTFGMGAFVVLGSLTGLSYQDSVTRGELLYPLKQGAEQVEGRFAFTTQDKVNTELRFADRRLNEAWNIVQESPGDTQAFLITTAYAQDPNAPEIELNAGQSRALADTLAEMHAHISLASSVVESDDLPAQVAADLLTAISDRADTQVQSLKQMKEAAPVKNRNTVALTAHSQESFVVSLVVAREEIRSVIAERGAQYRVRLAQFSVMNNDAMAQAEIDFNQDEKARNDNARNVLNQLETKITNLQPNVRAVAQARVTEARRALDAGKSSTAYGLSIAITQQIAHDANVIVKPKQNLSTQQAQQNNNTATQLKTPAATNTYYRQPVQNLIDQIPSSSVRTNTQSTINVAPQPSTQVQSTAPIIITPTQYTITPARTYTPTPQTYYPPATNTPTTPTQIITQPSTSPTPTQIKTQTGTTTTITNPTTQINTSGSTNIIIKPAN